MVRVKRSESAFTLLIPDFLAIVPDSSVRFSPLGLPSISLSGLDMERRAFCAWQYDVRDCSEKLHLSRILAMNYRLTLSLFAQMHRFLVSFDQG